MNNLLLEAFGINDTIKSYTEIVKDRLLLNLNSIEKRIESGELVEKNYIDNVSIIDVDETEVFDFRNLVSLDEYRKFPLNKMKLEIKYLIYITNKGLGFDGVTKKRTKGEVDVDNYKVISLKKDNEMIDSLSEVKIKISTNLNLIELKNRDLSEVTNSIAHELTHVLETLSKKQNGKSIGNSIQKNVGLSGYFTNAKIDLLFDFANLIYFNFPHEVKARNAQNYVYIKEKLKQVVNLDNLRYKEYSKNRINIQKEYNSNYQKIFIKILKDSEFYKKLISLENFNSEHYIKSLIIETSENVVLEEFNIFFNAIGSKFTKTQPNLITKENIYQFIKKIEIEFKQTSKEQFIKMLKQYQPIISEIIDDKFKYVLSEDYLKFRK